MNYLISNKIMAQFHYIPIYKFSIYKEKKIRLNGTENYFSNSLSIPIYVSLKSKDQKKIINLIKKFFN